MRNTHWASRTTPLILVGQHCAKCLIDIPCSDDVYECARAVNVFRESGSHFLVNAEWGCEDGVHNCWLMLEADNHDEARGVVPPAFRADATVIRLSRFDWHQVDEIMKAHH